MILSITRRCVLGVTVCLATASTALGQPSLRPGFRLTAVRATTSALISGDLYGTIQDERGQPLIGAVVSAAGTNLALEVSDREGRFVFRGLAPGTYLVRAHLEGYVPPRGSYVHITAGARQLWAISMNRSDDSPPVLAAAIGPVDRPATATPSLLGEPDDSEFAWRLRHLKRGVLKEAVRGVIDRGEGGDRFATFGRAVGSPARLASALFADLTLNGQVNLLTTTSFDRPQDLFSVGADNPRPFAYVALVAPTRDGDWTVRGSITQGEISSWILAGSFARSAPATHRYEAGLSYSTQQYQGGNAEALVAMSDGRRNAGELYGYDAWTVTPQFTVGLGGKYASYGYLTDRALLGGRMNMMVQPSPDDPLKLRVSVAHREVAPGAEEFVPPSSGLWLPPERTFSSLSRSAFRPERFNHVEVGGEREFRHAFVVGLRAFSQQIDDQIVTLFGVGMTDAPSTLGHYHVAYGGNFQNTGWGVNLSRGNGRAVQASLDYTQVRASRTGGLGDEDVLLRLAPSLVRDEEQIHDITASINSRFAATATRFLVVYKLSNAYAGDEDGSAFANARFDVQVNQEMPFLNFTGARWEMLVGVRNFFHADQFDGSVYDELLVVNPPKRVVGGVTVRF